VSVVFNAWHVAFGFPVGPCQRCQALSGSGDDDVHAVRGLIDERPLCKRLRIFLGFLALPAIESHTITNLFAPVAPKK
jgi:hypothetical protein